MTRQQRKRYELFRGADYHYHEALPAKGLVCLKKERRRGTESVSFEYVTVKEDGSAVNGNLCEAQQNDADGSAPSAGWIKIKDRLPEKHQYVLLLADRYWNTPDGVPDMKVTASGYLAEHGTLYWSVFGERGFDIDAFSHWMPIPDVDT